MEIEGLRNCVCILISLVLASYFYSRYKLLYWKRRGVHQLRNSHTIFGDFKNGILFQTAPGYHVGEIYRGASENAPYIGFYIFHKPCLLVRDPDMIKQILVRDFENFPDRHFGGTQQKDSIGMVNLFGLRNPAWRYLRRKLTATLTRGKLRSMLPLMLETGKTMMDHLGKQSAVCDGSHVVDVQDMNDRFTADLIASYALGTKTNSFDHPESEYTQSLSDFFHGFRRMVALATVFFVPELVQWIGSPMLFDSAFVGKLFWAALETREKTGEMRGDYIDSLIELKNGKQNKLFKFEGNNLLYQSGMFFSGFESSSTIVSFTLMELARNKRCQDRARDDIKNALKLHGWSLEAFGEMKYLDQCVTEGIRLYPPVSTLDRCALNDYKIPGTDTVIEQGTPVIVSLYGLHHDGKYFTEPEIFNPDRFADAEDVSPAFFPFGAGPRQCVAIKVGQLHVKVVLSMILSEYEVYQNPEETYELDSRSTFTAAANGIFIEFIKLNP